MASTLFLTLAQYSRRVLAFGKTHPIPTIARGTVFWSWLMDSLASVELAVELLGGQRLDPQRRGVERDPLAAEEMGAREHGRAVEDVARDERNTTILGRLQERPLGPFVEGSH